MLNEAKRITNLDNWTVDSTWAGFYLQGTTSEIFTKVVDDVIHIINGIGGKGMTTSAGYAEAKINQLFR